MLVIQKACIVALCAFLLSGLALGEQSAIKTEAVSYTPVMQYDPSRDAAKDIRDATEEARRSGKRVLIQVGGNWASWCHTMDVFFESHLDLRELRDENYVTVAVNFSRENQNKKLLAQYPKIVEYPHFFITDAEGKVLVSQWTSELEQGETYNPEKFRQFLLRWAPSQTGK